MSSTTGHTHTNANPLHEMIAVCYVCADIYFTSLLETLVSSS